MESKKIILDYTEYLKLEKFNKKLMKDIDELAKDNKKVLKLWYSYWESKVEITSIPEACKEIICYLSVSEFKELKKTYLKENK